MKLVLYKLLNGIKLTMSGSLAKIKHNDPGFQGKTLKDVCARIVGQSRGMGIDVVP